MNRVFRVFSFVLALMVIGSVAMAYYRFFVARDYVIQAETGCDPYKEACFVYVCDPSMESGCTGDITEDTSYYKLVNRMANNMPSCDVDDAACTVLTCLPHETYCFYTLCDSTTIEEGGACSDPIVYSQEHPIAEEKDSMRTKKVQDESEFDEGGMNLDGAGEFQ